MISSIEIDMNSKPYYGPVIEGRLICSAGTGPDLIEFFVRDSPLILNLGPGMRCDFNGVAARSIDIMANGQLLIVFGRGEVGMGTLATCGCNVRIKLWPRDD